MILKQKTSNHPRYKSQQGWTLLETMAAAIIIGFGAVLFTQIQFASNNQSRRNTDLLKAGQLIESQIDSLRTYIARDTLNNWTAFVAATSVRSTIGRITINRTVSTAYSPKNSSLEVNNVKQVDITASWGTGALDTMKVTTYVSRRF